MRALSPASHPTSKGGDRDVERDVQRHDLGCQKVLGALKNLGHEIGRNTIKRILLENGIDPAPERGRRMSWATFIKVHLGAIVGMEFFTVEAVTWLGLIR